MINSAIWIVWSAQKRSSENHIHRKMGREVADVCTDQQKDCLVIYPNGDDNHDPQDEICPGHDKFIDLDDPIKGDTEPQIISVNTESKEYEVKECTTENSVGIANFYQDENFEKGQDVHSGKISKFDNGTPEKKGLECEAQKPNNHKKLNSPVKLASRSTNVGIVRSNVTVPQPFALATEKRASTGSRSSGTEAPAGGINKTANVTLPSSKVKQNKPNSRKPLQPDNTKHPDEEDSSSVASSIAASVRTLKIGTTMASAPIFRSSERAEKRKEYYSKLEEKHQALEAERNQWEARTKEEREAAIKQFRKSLTFKATPMPSFYHEGPPPKTELRKVPPTRAKSPKLGRRKSLNDAMNPPQGENGRSSSQVNRHSTGTYKGDNRNENAAFKDKVPSKLVRESTKSLPLKMTQSRNVDIAVHS